MSKYTIIGDPHATPGNLDKIKQLFEIARELGNPVIILGDLFDTKEIIRGKCLNLVLDLLSESNLIFYILVGNHDWFNLDCEDHSLQALNVLPNVHIIDDVYDHSDFCAIPYIHDQKKLKAAIKKCHSNKPLFAHLELKGFDFGNGYICESGLTERSFATFKKVISGHFHKYQEKGNLIYLGTPFSHSFGESNQDKYIGVYDTETNELELQDSGFPKHITLEIDCSSNVELRYNDTDHIVRMILTGSQKSIDKWKSAAHDIPEGYKIIERPTDQFANELVIDETLDNVAKFKHWAKDIKGLSTETTNLGSDILESLK